MRARGGCQWDQLCRLRREHFDADFVIAVIDRHGTVGMAVTARAEERLNFEPGAAWPAVDDATDQRCGVGKGYLWRRRANQL